MSSKNNVAPRKEDLVKPGRVGQNSDLPLKPQEALGILKSSQRCVDIQVSMPNAHAVNANLQKTGTLITALSPGDRIEM